MSERVSSGGHLGGALNVVKKEMKVASLVLVVATLLGGGGI